MLAQRGELNRSPSTISRELARNRQPDGKYDPGRAHRKALDRRRLPTVTRKLEDPVLLQRVRDLLLAKWSPQQISGQLQRTDGRKVISHQTIYSYLWCLPKDHADRRAMRRKGKRPRKAKPGFITRKERERVSIDKRPKVANSRKRFGDWELDLMTCSGISGYLITAVERKSGYSLIRKVASKHNYKVIDGILRMFGGIDRSLLKTFTFDNGTEFYHTGRLRDQLGVKVYFADPYNSGQRGTNENTNGLIRQYFPKTLHYGLISYRDVQKAQQQLNDRPRLRLQFQTPAAVLEDFSKIAFRI